MKVFIQGWIDFEIENPQALADAAQMFPYEYNFSDADRDKLTPEVTRNLAHALQMSVSMKMTYALANLGVPGVSPGQQSLRYSTEPLPGAE
jgi:hypothetical protein